MKNVLIVVGSLREKSFNRQLADKIKAALEGRAEVRELEYQDLPWINQDIEFPAPTAVQRVRDELAVADGIWFVCPEYNGSFPGHVKNLVDWLSRPVVAGDYATAALAGKQVTMSGCAGKSGSKTMQAQLAQLMDYMPAEVAVMAEPTVGIVIPGESWATDVLTLADEDLAAIDAQVDAFLRFSND